MSDKTSSTASILAASASLSFISSTTGSLTVPMVDEAVGSRKQPTAVAFAERAPMMCPSVRLLKEALERPPIDDDGRRALTHPLAIRIRMAEDICSLRQKAVNRWELREFGWTDLQIDGWFESAMQEADGLGAHL